jgi:hypothetical protein
MGRQHTIYLSDVTWVQLESLKKENKTMSETIRNAIDICAQQSVKFDLIEYQKDVIEAYKRKVLMLESEMCNKCKVELVR